MRFSIIAVIASLALTATALPAVSERRAPTAEQCDVLIANIFDCVKGVTSAGAFIPLLFLKTLR